MSTRAQGSDPFIRKCDSQRPGDLFAAGRLWGVGGKPRGLPQFPAQLAEVTVAHQPLPLFIPEAEGERSETREERDRFHRLEQRHGLVAALEVVVRNGGPEMMDMMETRCCR